MAVRTTCPKFNPLTALVLLGGDFPLGQPKTVGDLRLVLQRIDHELADWGDATEITQVWTDKGVIQVTLTNGIV